jgi:hypothetical protein
MFRAAQITTAKTGLKFDWMTRLCASWALLSLSNAVPVPYVMPLSVEISIQVLYFKEVLPYAAIYRLLTHKQQIKIPLPFP